MAEPVLAKHHAHGRAGAVCWWLAAILCAATVWLFIAYSVAAVGFPAQINIGEGVVLHQALLVPGPAMYGDIFHYPFMVFEYPPVYLLASRAVALLGANLLVAGRLVSILSTLAACGLLAFLVRRSVGPAPASWAGAAIAAALPLSVLPVIVWVPLMRVDMLGLALTFAGLVLVLESKARGGFLALAMILFVAAVFTRQTYVAAPAASAGISFLRAPKATLLAAAFGMLLGLVCLWWLDVLTQGGFFRHVVVYLGHNGFDFASGVRQVGWWSLRYCTFWLLAVWGPWVAWPRQLPARALLARVRADDGAAVLATMALYLAIATVMTVLIGKSGAWLNYLIEWMWVGAFWAGYACTRALAARSVWAVPLVLALQMANGPISIMAWRNESLAPDRLVQNAALVARLKRLPDPIMSDDMVALWQAGRDLGVESFMFAELARVGVLPEADLVSLIQKRAFSAIVTDRGPGNSVFDTRYLPATQRALTTAYTRSQTFGNFILRQPD